MSSRRRPWMLPVAALAWMLAASAGPVAAQEAAPGAYIEWRTDYNQALLESEKRGLPIVIDFTMKPCFFCDKLDATTFRDPRVVGLMNQKFVALKIDRNRDPKLVDDLRIQYFPTLVIAGPARKILHMKEGYLDADAFHELLERHAAQVATPDWMRQHYDLARKAFDSGDYARALTAVKSILDDSSGKAIHGNAQKLAAAIEAKAQERLTKAKALVAGGKSTEAVLALTETLSTFPGSPAAREAADMLTKLAQNNELRQQQRNRRAAELMAQARDFYRTKDIIPCLDRCEILLASYGDLAEGAEALELVQTIRGNPEWLQAAADTLADRLASVYLALADNMTKRGKPREAEALLRRVIQAFPGTRYAESAQIRIGQIQGIPANRVETSGGME
ncbi:MAG: thioredoxin family protein [Gemmataceae bacterium]|nr:thioredoxin family protein [Gemmataceae bacterium]